MTMDYKKTLNLPQTGFPMKADLINSEPKRLAKWDDRGPNAKGKNLYERIQAARANAEKFVLHDGPPFANGDVHIGTALNKILKDMIVKHQGLLNRDAPYVPGWDCHGLPIEFKVTQEIQKHLKTAPPPSISEQEIKDVLQSEKKPSIEQAVAAITKFAKTADEALMVKLMSGFDAASIRKACEAYALKYIDIQRAQFKRLGVLADWDNPYLTLNKEYEADELRLFADIVEKDFVYRGKKPVYWSIPCRTALAEAEVEYQDHVSQSIFVKFRIDVEKSHQDTKNLIPQNAFVVIWTTTPWTLPANLAVAFNSNLNYCFVQHTTESGVEEHLLVASDLAQKLIEKAGLKSTKVSTNYPGYSFQSLCYEHPFIKRFGQFFAGDAFVTADTGTGFVHIAPGHGLDDYNLGRQNGLPIYSPVDDDGRFAHTNELPVEKQMPVEMLGKSILEKHGKSDANEAVLHELRLRHALLHQENYHHSYPHCWRSKTPVIFRAMDQWFIKIDHQDSAYPQQIADLWAETKSSSRAVFQQQLADLSAKGDNSTFGLFARSEIPDGFRKLAITYIDCAVKWIPDWGKNRIESAVKTRPDWCISRQRSWGVPIPAFYNPKDEWILDAQIIRNTADLIEKHGSNIWFEKNILELWALVKPKDWKGAEPEAKSNDTLDVWIDSGSSSRAVIARRLEIRGKDKPFQADMYLEGSDQHRGWFQSSLLLSLAGNGAAPFKSVLTHGFIVDADREKISKSKQGAYEKPQTSEAYVKKYGADVLRLWVASQDYRSDIVVSDERINKVSETYRNLRNTLRYQLSNLYDFDPAKDTVPDAALTGLDRWILGQFSKLEKEAMAAYGQHEFHVVYQKVSQFAAVELSAMYHDLVKDRLYTDAASSPRRRSTQTALHRMVRGLCSLLSPILVFTADEAWEFIPGRETASVHLAAWRAVGLALPEEEESRWKKLWEIREKILPFLEKERQAKNIGKALDARVTLGETAKVLPGQTDKDNDVLRELLNVSQLVMGESAGTGDLSIQVTKANGQKCERCWHWEEDVGATGEHPTLCGRCVLAIKSCAIEK